MARQLNRDVAKGSLDSSRNDQIGALFEHRVSNSQVCGRVDIRWSGGRIEVTVRDCINLQYRVTGKL